MELFFSLKQAYSSTHVRLPKGMKLLSAAVPMDTWRKHFNLTLPEQCCSGQRKDSSPTQGKAERDLAQCRTGKYLLGQTNCFGIQPWLWPIGKAIHTPSLHLKKVSQFFIMGSTILYIEVPFLCISSIMMHSIFTILSCCSLWFSYCEKPYLIQGVASKKSSMESNIGGREHELWCIRWLERPSLS